MLAASGWPTMGVRVGCGRVNVERVLVAMVYGHAAMTIWIVTDNDQKKIQMVRRRAIWRYSAREKGAKAQECKSDNQPRERQANTTDGSRLWKDLSNSVEHSDWMMKQS